jgi:hypothetical protein
MLWAPQSSFPDPLRKSSVHNRRSEWNSDMGRPSESSKPRKQISPFVVSKISLQLYGKLVRNSRDKIDSRVDILRAPFSTTPASCSSLESRVGGDVVCEGREKYTHQKVLWRISILGLIYSSNIIKINSRHRQKKR